MSRNAASKIIIALDVDSRDKARSLIADLDRAETFKIGLRLFTAEGPALLDDLRRAKKRIFIDLKLHDIPNTVAGAVEAAAKHGVSMMTLHASGGGEMMARAAAALSGLESGSLRPLLLAVTVLTSLKDAQLPEVGLQGSVGAQVVRLARLAKRSGMDGIVCSPQELDLLRKELGRDFIIVTPGIRPVWAAAQDQKRILTPAEALKRGADYMVIGRPIIAAPSPKEALDRIIEELESLEPSYGKNGP